MIYVLYRSDKDCDDDNNDDDKDNGHGDEKEMIRLIRLMIGRVFQIR